MNTRVHILSGMDLVYKWCDVLYNGLKSIQNYLFLNVFNYRYIQSQLLSVLLFLFLLSSGCHVNYCGWFYLNPSFVLHLESVADCIAHTMQCTRWQSNILVSYIIRVLIKRINLFVEKIKNLLANKFCSARLKLSVANGFSVPLSMNHGS